MRYSGYDMCCQPTPTCISVSHVMMSWYAMLWCDSGVRTQSLQHQNNCHFVLPVGCGLCVLQSVRDILLLCEDDSHPRQGWQGWQLRGHREVRWMTCTLQYCLLVRSVLLLVLLFHSWTISLLWLAWNGFALLLLLWHPLPFTAATSHVHNYCCS